MGHGSNLDILYAFAVTSVCVEHLVKTINTHIAFHCEALNSLLVMDDMKVLLVFDG